MPRLSFWEGQAPETRVPSSWRSAAPAGTADRAWKVPDGLRPDYLPRYSPELQPAECLWSVLDEPIANKYFETIAQLDALVAERCCILDTSPDLFKRRTNFHWWPKTHSPN